MKPGFLFAALALFASQYTFAAVVAGPDGFGYMAHTAGYNLRDIQGTGTRTPGGDDDLYTVPIGFDFTFKGLTMNSIGISMNGFLAGLTGESDFRIEGYLDDLNAYGAANGSGDTYYHTVGSPGSREFIVGYYGVSHSSCCAPPDDPMKMTFEIILHEGSNNIEFQYAELFDQALWDTYYIGTGIGLPANARHGSIGLTYFPFNPADNLSISNAAGYQEYTGYMITYVPLPPAFWLLGSGLAGLIGLAGKRQKPARARPQHG